MIVEILANKFLGTELLILHNYVRPHMDLEGKTIAEACGIAVQGNNKWLTLIQNASKSATSK